MFILNGKTEQQINIIKIKIQRAIDKHIIKTWFQPLNLFLFPLSAKTILLSKPNLLSFPFTKSISPLTSPPRSLSWNIFSSYPKLSLLQIPITMPQISTPTSLKSSFISSSLSIQAFF